jgi:hypothetical protein
MDFLVDLYVTVTMETAMSFLSDVGHKEMVCNVHGYLFIYKKSKHEDH